MMREKPPQRNAAEVFPQARFSRNDKMVRAKRDKRGKFSCRSFFYVHGTSGDALAEVALPGKWLKCTH